MLRPVFLFVVLLASCNGVRDTHEARDPGGTTASATVAPDAPVGTPACPATGLWSPCAVLERLDRAGLAPRLDSSRVEQPPLTAPGQRLHVGNSELELYFYPDQVAREADAAKLDLTKYVTYGAPVPVQRLPTLIQSVNVIGILHSRNDHQRERVGDALTAGPPQPARP